MDTSDKRPDETWAAYWNRKHDERHGTDCRCMWIRSSAIFERARDAE